MVDSVEPCSQGFLVTQDALSSEQRAMMGVVLGVDDEFVYAGVPPGALATLYDPFVVSAVDDTGSPAEGSLVSVVWVAIPRTLLVQFSQDQVPENVSATAWIHVWR